MGKGAPRILALAVSMSVFFQVSPVFAGGAAVPDRASPIREKVRKLLAETLQKAPSAPAEVEVGDEAKLAQDIEQLGLTDAVAVLQEAVGLGRNVAKLREDKVLWDFVREKLAQVGKVQGEEARGEPSGEFEKKLKTAFGPDATVQAGLTVQLAGELAGRYRQAGRLAEELALASAVRDMLWADRTQRFVRTSEMVRVALDMGELSLAIDIACEYLAQERCSPAEFKWDEVLLTRIARKAEEVGKCPIAFQCQRMAALLRERKVEGRRMDLRGAFVVLDPGLKVVFADQWPATPQEQEKWLDRVSGAWGKQPALEISPDVKAFVQTQLTEAIRAGAGRVPIARMHMLLGEGGQAVEVLTPADEDLSDAEWDCLCRILILVTGDPRALTAGNPALKGLGLKLEAMAGLESTLKKRDPAGKQAAAWKEAFFTEALEGARLALERSVGKTPGRSGELLAAMLGTPLFEQAMAQMRSRHALSEQVMAALAKKVAESDGERKAAYLEAIVGALESSDGDEGFDKLISSFPGKTPEEDVAQFSDLVKACGEVKCRQALDFRVASYLYAKDRNEAALKALDAYSAAYKTPEDRVYVLRALCLLKMDKTEEARQACLKLLEEFPKSPLVEKALFLIGWSHVMDGQGEKGVEWFERLVKEHPGGEYARKAEAFLERLRPKEEGPPKPPAPPPKAPEAP